MSPQPTISRRGRLKGFRVDTRRLYEMSFSVTVKPSGRTFTVDSDETVLAAALRHGLNLPYGCKNGACGTCKGRIVEGSVELGPHQLSALSAQEEASGLCLFCSATPQSDLVIESREVQGAGEIPIRKMPCRVARIERPAPDVAILHLQLPANERLQYLAGQYLEFILKDGKRRSYSIANAPHSDGPLQLHVRHMAGGVFTDQVFGAGAAPMKERDILRFEGPMGTFFLREDSDKPIILLASGTGFAPIKAIAEHLFDRGVERRVVLYWGARTRRDLYMHELPVQWAAQHTWFRYVPVLSEALAEDAWTGRTGLVHRAVMEDIPDLSGHQVYACGVPVMVDAARRDFTTACRLPPEEFYADAFTSEADKPPAA